MTRYTGPGGNQARRMYAATECATCGSKTTLQRHHKDRNRENNTPENIEILCRECHKNEHMNAGDWGRGQVKPATCKICGSIFRPKRSRRSTICSAECGKTMGKISAEKRWGKSKELQQALPIAHTDLKPLAMDKLAEWRQQHSPR